MLRSLVSLVVPPLCGVCARPAAAREEICERCEAALRAAVPRTTRLPCGLEVLSSAPYDGVAGRLVAAMKFAGRIALARRAGAALAQALERRGWSASAIVPVPPSPARARSRGFDLTQLLAAALAERTAARLLPALGRADGPRQVGRSRAARVADPPRIQPVRALGGESVLLVDDVLTTGATLAACARAVRAAGGDAPRALTLAWA